MVATSLIMIVVYSYLHMVNLFPNVKLRQKFTLLVFRLSQIVTFEFEYVQRRL